MSLLKTVTMLSVMAATGLLESGCSTAAATNPNDATPPVIEIKFQDFTGQYVAAPETMSLGAVSGDLKITAVFSDPEGLHSVGLSVAGDVNGCGQTTETSTITPLPSPVGDTFLSTAKLLTKIPLFTRVSGPFKCHTAFAVDGQKDWSASGGKIVVIASATNWSSSSKPTAAKVLTIKLQ